jgi:hypothetical protein
MIWKAIRSMKKDNDVEQIASSISSFVQMLTFHFAEAADLTPEERAVIMDAISKLAISEKEPPNYTVSFSLAGAPVTGSFLGREADLEWLKQHLDSKKGVLRRQICVIYGLGGLGKTQLAIEYARRSKQAYSSVFWLNGATEESLVQSILQNAPRFPEETQAGTTQGSTFAESKAGALAVLRWFSQPENNKWLLIFDNVDRTSYDAPENDRECLSAYDITEYFPDGDAGSIIVTTRLQRLSTLGESLKLKKLSDKESLQILEKYSRKVFRKEASGSNMDNSAQPVVSSG